VIKRGLIVEAESWRGISSKVVGIQSKNRKEWLITDIGLSYLHGVALVCLYDTLGPDTVGFILNHTKPIACFCDSLSTNSLLKSSDIGKVSTIICYDVPTED
jgi:long-chain acyl-CoA synthetase